MDPIDPLSHVGVTTREDLAYRPSFAAASAGAAEAAGRDAGSGFAVWCALEAWVCKTRSYTEIYAKDLALLERLAAAGDGVRTVESRKT